MAKNSFWQQAKDILCQNKKTPLKARSLKGKEDFLLESILAPRFLRQPNHFLRSLNLFLFRLNLYLKQRRCQCC